MGEKSLDVRVVVGFRYDYLGGMGGVCIDEDEDVHYIHSVTWDEDGVVARKETLL